MGSTPRTWRTVPSSDSSPTTSVPSRLSGGICSAGDQHAQGDGQVVGRAFLAHGGGGQVDGDALAREEQPGVLDGRLHALAAFLHGGIGQADDGHDGQALAGVHFDLDDDAFQADDGAGIDAGKHGISVHEDGQWRGRIERSN